MKIVYIPGYGSDLDGAAVGEFLGGLRHEGHDVHYVPVTRMRSYKHSKQGDCPASLWHMALGVYAYLRDNNLRDVALIGHSMGGVVAAIVAVHWPERVTRVAAVCSSSIYKIRLRTMAWRMFVNTARDYWHAYSPRLWPAHPHRKSLRVFLKGARWYVGWRWWELRRAIQEAKALRAALLPRLGLRLAELNVPLSMFCGDLDEQFEARLVAAALQDVKLSAIPMPEAIHNCPQHQASLLLHYMQASGFLSTTPERS